jgi:hypothetical protein
MTVTKVVNSETYRWSYLIFDVAKINADIELKVLNGVSVVLSRATIEWYAEVILGLTGGAQPFPQIGKINTHYARQLAAPRADEPIVLAQLRRSQSDFSNDLNAGLDVPGTLYYDPCSLQILKPSNFSSSDILVIDGNHRMACAYYHETKAVTGVVLQKVELEKYLLWE